MSEHTVYLALGTNLGDRRANLLAALAGLESFSRVKIISSIYETAPWGYADQPDFYNMAAMLSTALAPRDLLDALKSLEKALGRVTAVRYGPRMIDLDILLYDDIILNTPELTIPHPLMEGRAFVLLPLAEIASDFCVPGLNATVADLLQAVSTEDVVKVGVL